MRSTDDRRISAVLYFGPSGVAVAAFALLVSGTAPSVAAVESLPLASPLAPSPAPSDAPSDARDPYAAFVSEASHRFGVPENWIRAVMRVESAGDPSATSHKGAMGLMQVMPQTWVDLRARHGFGPNAYDPRESILAGAAYLREMHDRYGTVEGMLAAYNAGPGRYDDYFARGRPLPWETVNYVAMIAPIIGGTAFPLPAGAPVARVIDPLAAPLFVARAADRQEPSVQTVAVPAAALTADEARLIAAQTAKTPSSSAPSERKPAANRATVAVQPERTTNASQLLPASASGGLFVPRSQPEPRP